MKPRTTHEHVDRAIQDLLRLVKSCGPQHQPEPQVLETLTKLLELHQQGTPAGDFAEQLKRLVSRVQTLEDGGVLSHVMAGTRKRP